MKLEIETLKLKDKEAHNLNKKIVNLQDIHTNLKSELSETKSIKKNLEYELKKLKQKVTKIDTKQMQQTVSSQTVTTRNTLFSVQDSVLPNSSLQLCLLSKSLPNLKDVRWDSVNDDDELVLGDHGCDICCLTFTSRMSLQIHNKEFPLCCRDCGVCFSTLHEVKQHDVETDHEGD